MLHVVCRPATWKSKKNCEKWETYIINVWTYYLVLFRLAANPNNFLSLNLSILLSPSFTPLLYRRSLPNVLSFSLPLFFLLLLLHLLFTSFSLPLKGKGAAVICRQSKLNNCMEHMSPGRKYFHVIDSLFVCVCGGGGGGLLSSLLNYICRWKAIRRQNETHRYLE